MKKIVLFLAFVPLLVGAQPFGGGSGPFPKQLPVVTMSGPVTGSTTAGIQAAINGLTTTDLLHPFAGGGEIDMGPGIYYVTNTISIPNSGAYYLKLKGAGKMLTIIKYVGDTTDTGGGSNLFNTAVDTVTGPAGQCSLNIIFEGIGFSHVKFNNYANLLRLFALNELDVENCGFFTEQVLTNGGSSLNYVPGAQVTASGTVGIYAGGCNMVRVRNSSFWGCPYGFIGSLAPGGAGGHLRFFNNIFDGCKTNTSRYAYWQEPIGSFNIPTSAAIVNLVQDCIAVGNQYDGCTIPEYSVGATFQTISPVYESCTMNHVVDGVNGGNFECISPNTAMSAYGGVERKMAADGTMSTPSAGSIVVYGGYVTSGNLFTLTDGGTVRLSVGTSAGVIAGNGSGLTNVPPNITNFTVYAVGTAYTLTGSSAALDFGTTDPVLTINQAGTYLIQGHVGILYSGATYVGAQTATLKFRRTNNTAADLANGSIATELPVLTTFTGGDSISMPSVIYTATSGDTVTIFGILSATPSAGSVQANACDITAIRLY